MKPPTVPELATTTPAGDTVKTLFISNEPAVILPKSEFIAAKLVVDIFSATIVFAVICAIVRFLTRRVLVVVALPQFKILIPACVEELAKRI